MQGSVSVLGTSESNQSPVVETLDFKPRMTAAEVELLDRTLSLPGSYLEFGCGGSTLAALKSPLQHITSVETDRAWIQKLRGHPEISKAEKTGRLRFRHIDLGPVGDWGFPKGNEEIRRWPEYSAEIWRSPDAIFDVILVDGRFRAACALMAAQFATPTTSVLIHDYLHRPGYYLIEKYFDTIDIVNTLVVMRRRPNINMRAWSLDLVACLLDPN